MHKTLSLLALALGPALAADPHAGHPHGPTPGLHPAMPQGAGAGRPGDPAQVSRTIEIIMDDSMRFAPSQVSVKAGETIRFFIRNKGKRAHEFVLGSAQALEAHATTMKQMPDMQHAEPNMIHLGAGQRGAIVWQFDRPGEFEFACLLPGHWDAGMVGTLRVE